MASWNLLWKYALLLYRMAGQRWLSMLVIIVVCIGGLFGLQYLLHIWELQHSIPKIDDNWHMRDIAPALRWSSLSHNQKMTVLIENPVYAPFSISAAKPKKRVNLLLIVSSTQQRRGHRHAIRETWLSLCSKSYQVTVDCVFMTDQVPDTSSDFDDVLDEIAKFKDMVTHPVMKESGFGMRYMYELVWAVSNYDFDYLVRLDDDYFLCLDRLLYELPMPMEGLFHWGFTHCADAATRLDDSIVLFSRDVVEIILAQDPLRILCHPSTGHLISAWISDMGLPNLYRHDSRLHHDPPARESQEILSMQNVCATYVGVRGANPDAMKRLWRSRGDFLGARNGDVVCNLKNCSTVCPFSHTPQFGKFRPSQQFQPARCIRKPVWDTSRLKVDDPS